MDHKKDREPSSRSFRFYKVEMGNEVDNMDIKGPDRWEINLNTLVILVGFAVSIFGAGIAWADVKSGQEKFDDWRVSHEAMHKERNAELTGDKRATDERFRAMEGRLATLDQLGYRLTVNEQATATSAQVLKEVQATVNKQTVDQATMLVILNRIEATLRQNTASLP